MLSKPLQILIDDNMLVSYLTDCRRTLRMGNSYAGMFFYKDTEHVTYYESEPYFSSADMARFTQEDMDYIQTT